MVLVAPATEILHDFPGLEAYKPDLERTLRALGLQPGQRYFSVGIGRNILSLLVALHGVEVIGIDTERERRDFQQSLARRYALPLKAARGSLSVMDSNIDATPSSELPSGFDFVECVNFQHNYDTRDIAQTLISLGVPDARFFVSLFGGPRNENNGLVLAVQREAENLRRRLKVAVPDLYSSTTYHSTASLLCLY